MSKILAEQLLIGIIFGDISVGEYIYMPAGEIGSDNPLCVIEQGKTRRDISLSEAITLIGKLNLIPVHHPRLGDRSC